MDNMDHKVCINTADKGKTPPSIEMSVSLTVSNVSKLAIHNENDIKDSINDPNDFHELNEKMNQMALEPSSEIKPHGKLQVKEDQRSNNSKIEERRLENLEKALNNHELLHISNHVNINPDPLHYRPYFTKVGGRKSHDMNYRLVFKDDDNVDKSEGNSEGNSVENSVEKSVDNGHDIGPNISPGRGLHTIECKFIKCSTVKLVNDKSLKVPWYSTQLINDPWHKHEESERYLEYWYNNIIPKIRDTLPNLPPPPSKEVFMKDASVGSVQSDFGMALKKFKMNNPCEYNDYFIKWHKSALEYAFEDIMNTDGGKRGNFAKRMKKRIIEKLAEKDVFLNGFFPSSSCVSFKEDDGFTAHVIKVCTESLSDIEVQFKKNNEGIPNIILLYSVKIVDNEGCVTNIDHIGEARLRWGNGNGIANLRWNIR
jgi:hypothetical protein